MSEKQPEALRLADWLFDNVEHINHADSAAELRRLHRQSEVLRAERDHARACYDATVKLLVGIHALLYPAPTTLPDGRVMVFRPKSLDPHDVLQELSDRIRALPDELEKFAAIQQAEAQQPATGEPMKSFAELREKHRAGIDAERAKLDAAPEPVAWRHSRTHSLHDFEYEVELADADSWAEPLYTHPAPSVPATGEPVKVVPYNPTTEMMFSMKGIDPALSLNQCRELWSVAWKAAPTNHPAPSVPADVVRDAERWRYAISDGGNQSMNFMDIFDDWDGDGSFVEAFDAARIADKQGGAP